MGGMTAAKKMASARATPFGDLELRFPFCQDLVDDLKSEIPAPQRRWDREEGRWLVSERFTPEAVALLLSYFPRAEVPPEFAPARRVVTPPAPPPSADLDAALAKLIPPPAPDAGDLAPIIAVIPCPKCGQRREQPVRVVAESSVMVARSERPAAEMVSVCPSCKFLAVVSFHPAASGERAAS